MTDTHVDAPRAKFHAMTEGTPEDWQIIAAELAAFGGGLPDRILANMRLLGDDHGGFVVDRLTHCLQTAARAEKAGRDDDYVLCALIHDIGDTLGPYNHADVGAAILKPFVPPHLHWMVEHHGIFQGYYFFHHIGLDRDMREKFRGHENFDLTAEFCQDFDQPAFDPAYPTPSLEHYEPLIRAKMQYPVRSIYAGNE